MIEPIKGEFNYTVSTERGTLLVSEYYLRDVLIDLGLHIAHSGGTDWDSVVVLARKLGFTPVGYIEELDMELYVTPLTLVDKSLRPYFSGHSSEQWWKKELPAGEPLFSDTNQSVSDLLLEQIVLKKAKDVGAYYAAQQVATNIDELKEHGFTYKELGLLEEKGLSFIEAFITNTYLPFHDLTEKEVTAIKSGLKEYPPYGLVNDWSLGISDFDYDIIMVRYMNKKMSKIGGRRGVTYEQHDKLYSRLYVTVLNIQASVRPF